MLLWYCCLARNVLGVIDRPSVCDIDPTLIQHLVLTGHWPAASPIKCYVLKHCWYNAGQPSATPAQQYTSIGCVPRVIHRRLSRRVSLNSRPVPEIPHLCWWTPTCRRSFPFISWYWPLTATRQMTYVNVSQTPDLPIANVQFYVT